MRPQKVDDQRLMAGLTKVLRAKGFDGASMNDMSEATGLKKASLYHRFPGGKKEITEAVLEYSHQWSKTHIYNVLTDTSLPPKLRLKQGLENIRTLYDDGESICILRSLTMGSSLPEFRETIEGTFQLWIEAFKQLGTDSGLDEAKAAKLALDNIIMIQGALVLSKALQDTTPFQQSLKEIKEHYIV